MSGSRKEERLSLYCISSQMSLGPDKDLANSNGTTSCGLLLLSTRRIWLMGLLLLDMMGLMTGSNGSLLGGIRKELRMWGIILDHRTLVLLALMGGLIRLGIGRT